MISNKELIEKLQCTRADCTGCPMCFEEQVEQDLYRLRCAAREAATRLWWSDHIKPAWYPFPGPPRCGP